jgi:hypothetical protein
MVSEYGTQRACLKAKVHWDCKGSNPTANLICGDAISLLRKSGDRSFLRAQTHRAW